MSAHRRFGCDRDTGFVFESLFVAVVHDLHGRTDDFHLLAMEVRVQFYEGGGHEGDRHCLGAFYPLGCHSLTGQVDLGDVVCHRVFLSEELLDQGQAVLGVGELTSELFTMSAEDGLRLVGISGAQEHADLTHRHPDAS
jgi:hypothetical protein